MTAIDRSMVTIYIVAADTVPSALATSDAVKGEITSWNLTGGNRDVDSMPAFGGFIDKEKPRGQFELSMEVTPVIGTNTNRWDEYKYGSTLKSSGEGGAKAIFIQAYDTEGSTYKSMGLNNCRGVTWEPSHSADDNLSGSFTWKFSPTTNVGVANLQTSSVAASALPSWS